MCLIPAILILAVSRGITSFDPARGFAAGVPALPAIAVGDSESEFMCLAPGSSRRATADVATGVHWPTAYPDLTPTVENLSWGTRPNEVLDIYAHPGSSSGRSVVFYLHYGAGTSGDHKQPALAGSGGGNALAWYLTEDVCQHLPVTFDFVSVNFEQWAWNTPTPVTHIAPWSATDNPTAYPRNVAYLTQLFVWATANAPSFGWDPDEFHLMGSSHGGTLAMLARLQYRVPVKTLIIESPIPDYRNPLIFWPVGQGMYGTSDQASWDAVDDSEKDAVSVILEFSRGVPANYVPLYALNWQAGDGSVPYGSQPGGSVHDLAQWKALTGALASSVPESSWKAESYPRLTWETPKTGVAISKRVYNFMVAHQ